MTDHIPSKPLGEQLRDALNLYGWHLSWCKKLAQMPMEPGRTYLWPKDDAEWRAQQPCTCKWDEVANTLVRSTDETNSLPDPALLNEIIKPVPQHEAEAFAQSGVGYPAEKAFVQLCAPHGKDWLTCPECAKAAGIGSEQA